MRFDRTDTADELHARYADLAPDSRTGNQTSVAGRVTSIRGHGKLEFVTLQDVSGSIQLLMSASLLELPGHGGPRPARSGRLVGRGRRGGDEPAGRAVGRGHLAHTALQGAPPPARQVARTERRGHAVPPARGGPASQPGLTPRLRRPVQDAGLHAPDLHRTRASSRSRRRILQSLAGGAIARPFVTHSNALDIELSLRIAPELFLKRLVVGGYERVFEIARNFRNEGIDTRHSPEFTSLEAYRAFGDVHDGIDLTERAIVTAAARRDGSTHLHGG